MTKTNSTTETLLKTKNTWETKRSISQLQSEVVAVNVNIQSVHATLCQDRVQNPQTAGEWCLHIQVKLWVVIMVLCIPAGSICGGKRHIFSIDSQSRVAIFCMQPVNYNCFLLYCISYFARVCLWRALYSIKLTFLHLTSQFVDWYNTEGIIPGFLHVF